MKKRIVTVLLLASLALSGCGSNVPNAQSVPAASSASESVSEVISSADDVPAPNAESVSEDVLTEEDTEREPIVIEISDADDPDSFPITMIETDSVGIDLTGVEADEDYTWKLKITNKTDEDLAFILARASLNGMMCTPVFDQAASAGETVETEIVWEKDLLAEQLLSADDIQYMEGLIFATSGNYENDDYEDEMYQEFVVYTHGISDAAKALPDMSDAEELVDTENIGAYVRDYRVDDDGNLVLSLYIENRTEQNVVCALDMPSVDGVICDPYWAVEMTAGSGCCSSVIWSAEALKEAEIVLGDSLPQLDLPLLLFDTDDLGLDYLYADTVTFSQKPEGN